MRLLRANLISRFPIRVLNPPALAGCRWMGSYLSRTNGSSIFRCSGPERSTSVCRFTLRKIVDSPALVSIRPRAGASASPPSHQHRQRDRVTNENSAPKIAMNLPIQRSEALIFQGTEIALQRVASIVVTHAIGYGGSIRGRGRATNRWCNRTFLGQPTQA